ncbi:hypothetical protein ACRE_020420 [Hapsidospora chrysogenum ATCC 11550]|uniref:DUF1993 domain-containing protein n=1 Tax=Hapsidospora chrysogenum (strain ATCC 11550 / CBS 779.69 / DSM 880 / IAM 14645 / JCM 23072 / IMI 49137) TaxID=857340 RepID=A0A086TCV5_HAPC1|nr:hypothetical protein ACRE_020420 [Hapsidospora chrysogenum ATCC 11550]
MAFSLYDATIVALTTALTTLDDILTVAEKTAGSDRLPQARLYEDMKPLSFQVYAAARFAEKTLARLTGTPSNECADDLVSFADMHARIAEVKGLLAQADKETVNRLGEEVAPTEVPSAGSMDISGKAFAMGATVPNVNFHVATAYAILRKEGVPLGKKDYIMPFVTEHIMKPQQ